MPESRLSQTRIISATARLQRTQQIRTSTPSKSLLFNQMHLLEGAFSLLLLTGCPSLTLSYRQANSRISVPCRLQRNALGCTNAENLRASEHLISGNAAVTDAEMERLLIENDDNDGHDEHDLSIEDMELEEMDINLISESDIDRSIQNAVQKMVDSGPRETELSRVETFDNIYKSMKSKSKDPTVKMDHTSMLAALFSDAQRKDPFDEKKVMMKFRTMLKNEDFENLFRDPLIGDFL